MIQLHDLFFKKFISKTQINQAINGIVVKINEDYKKINKIFNKNTNQYLLEVKKWLDN